MPFFKNQVWTKTSKYLCIVGVVFLGVGLYFFLHWSPPSETISSRKILYWIDPMEPQIHYDKPGKSRMNMDVVPVYEEEQAQQTRTNSEITISPAIINNMGVRTVVVEEGLLIPSVRAFAIIKPDEKRITHIHTYAEGWVKKLHTKEMQGLVEKDQPLFEIYSKDLRLAQKEYLLSSKDHGKIDEEHSIGKLRSLGISEKQIEELKKTKQDKPLITVYAPQKGYIDSISIREGMWVKPEMTILSLTDLSEVWAIADVFPSNLPLIKVGQKANISVQNSSLKNLQSTVDYIYPEIDPTSLTAKVRIRLSNPEFLLKPNMYVIVDILGEPKKAIKIPSEAILWGGKGHHVIIAMGDGKFLPRPVVTGIEASGDVEILAGLKPGEHVVTSAQFLLDSEIFMKSGLERLEDPSSTHDPSHMAGQGS